MKEQPSVLYINAMGPMEKSPRGGVFVTQRIRALRTIYDADVIPVSLYVTYSKLTKFILRMKGVPDYGRALSKQMDVEYDLFEMKCSFIDMVLSKFTGRAFYHSSYKILKEILKKHSNAQVIHMHWIWMTGIALPDVAKRYNIPYIVTCHGSDINVAMRNELNRKHIVNILENAFRVEFVSNALLKTAKELGYSGRNAVVVYNGVDTNIFNGKRVSRSVYTVGYVGNLVPIKGADRLPSIFTRVYEMMEGNVRFVVTGDGSLRKELEAETNELPIIFHGVVSQESLADIYAEMDVLIIPSRNEGYGCVIKEGQACGVFPVGNDVGGISEAIGEYGTMIKKCDSEEELCSRIAEAAVSYLSSEKETTVNDMIKASRWWSWQERQKESVRLYSDILDISKV